ncbi:recombinase [Mycolicibacterium tokaiense]|uniref:Recombinase n=1 Tax=Mycolicibacterium tokaiense TaxID=39695 RepID=A0A378TFR9_9MYCO|nr:recombinase [Mycolicibacterium tokaiense]
MEYVDNDVSASSGRKRPAYERMLNDIRQGRIGAVVCWHLDRLHRQPIELETFVDLANVHRVALATVTGDVDLSTDDGRFTARIMGAVARKEIERKRARQLRAARQKAERGEPQWRRAFGYAGDTREPDPVTAPLVEQAYTAILAGASLGEVARTFNGAGAFGLTGRPWTATTVSLFLRKARNAGLRSHKHNCATLGHRPCPLDGEQEIVGKANWPALVPEATWRSVQAVLNAPGRAPGRKSVRAHLLTGILKCGKCGNTLSGNWQFATKTAAESGQRDYTLAYSCKTCRGCSIRAEFVEPIVIKLVGGRLAKADAINLLRSELHDPAEAAQMRAERLTLNTRLDEIADERADGMLTGQQAQRATERITAKLAVLDSREQSEERKRVLDGLELGTKAAHEAVGKLSPDRLRAVIDLLMTIVIAPVGKGGHSFKPERIQVAMLA